MNFILLIPVVALLVSCASAQSGFWNPISSGKTWPENADVARVEHLVSAKPGENFPVKAKKSAWSWFAGDVGVEPLVMPYGITSQTGGIVWTVSPTQQVVSKIDLRLDSVEYFQKIDGHSIVSPAGIYWDKNTGDLFVSDIGAQRVLSFNDNLKFTGYLDPPDRFGRPAGIAMSVLGDVFVVDVAYNRIAHFSKSREFVRYIGETDNLHGPTNVAVGPSGNIYVADSLNFRIVVFNSTGEYISEIGSLGDSPGYFARPRGIAVDSHDNIYVSDAAFDNIQIFDASGNLLMFLGALGSEDGYFSQPAGLSIDSNDRLFVADGLNNRVQLFQLYPYIE